MRILWLDPGPTTGFCIYQSDWLPRFSTWMVDLNKEGLPSDGGPHDTLWRLLSTMDFDVLGCEKFEFRKDDQKRDKIDLSPAEYNGVVKLYAQQNPHIKSVWQGSSLIGKTAFWSDNNQKVKQLGLYDPKCAPHGMDALRHLLYYLSFTLNQRHWFERLK